VIFQGQFQARPDEGLLLPPPPIFADGGLGEGFSEVDRAAGEDPAAHDPAPVCSEFARPRVCGRGKSGSGYPRRTGRPWLVR
jgi:hypothetical protein